ncbi:ferrous iron transport protein A [Verrucomicrobiota bacterium]
MKTDHSLPCRHRKRHRGYGRHRKRHRGYDGVEPYPLSECNEENICLIVGNEDRQSMEMGLFSGAKVRVIKNSIESPNMVVAINDSRYMLSKETARRIMVK